MAIGDSSSPVAFGKGQSNPVYDRELFLDIFGGEVFTAFYMATITEGKIQTRTLPKGMRSARFPKTWKSQAEHHTRGTELLGNDYQSGEINLGLLVA